MTFDVCHSFLALTYFSVDKIFRQASYFYYASLEHLSFFSESQNKIISIKYRFMLKLVASHIF